MIILGIVSLYIGIMYEETWYINLGLAGVFIGLVIMAFIPSDVINLDVYVKTILSYQSYINNMLDALNMEGNLIFIPPYENLPKGGIFIPKYKKFSINLGIFDEKTFLTQNGVLITPPIGYRFVEDFESYSNTKLEDTDLELVISIVSSVLKTFGLIGGIEFEEDDKNIKIIIEELKLSCDNKCIIPCPIVSSIIYAISISLNQLILLKNIKKQKNYIEIDLKKLGSVDEYLW
ncbi:MAG: hypothetical protein GXN95_04535 [Methanococci archaeon]|nr:hypothetical protein [Methanococci archaeon]